MRKANRRHNNGRREMHDAVCADCGAETQVPSFPEMIDQFIAATVIRTTGKSL